MVCVSETLDDRRLHSVSENESLNVRVQEIGHALRDKLDDGPVVLLDVIS